MTASELPFPPSMRPSRESLRFRCWASGQPSACGSQGIVPQSLSQTPVRGLKTVRRPPIYPNGAQAISDFRKDNVDTLSGLFVQVLALCQQAGLVKLGHVALDGTKVKANASKHKAMSYQRMKEKAAQLAAEVAELLRQAQAADDEEDRRYGKDKRGDELPQELAFREGRLEKIREAMAALEAEAQAAAEQAEAEGGNHPWVPDDKAQRNFTDTESRIIPAPGGKDFLQAYNCQAVVDSAHQVIVAARATNQRSDKQQAAAMMEETIDNVGAVPREVSADAGYYSAKAVGELYALGVDPFVAPEQTRHGRVVPPAPWDPSLQQPVHSFDELVV